MQTETKQLALAVHRDLEEIEAVIGWSINFI